MNSSASTSLVLLLRLIAANDWEQLKDMFLSDPEGERKFQYLATLIAKSSSFNGMTISMPAQDLTLLQFSLTE